MPHLPPLTITLSYVYMTRIRKAVPNYYHQDVVLFYAQLQKLSIQPINSSKNVKASTV